MLCEVNHSTSLRRRRKHKAQGGAKRNLGKHGENNRARETGDRTRMIEALCRPLRGLRDNFGSQTQGYASLHPGLYASACSAGSLSASKRVLFSFSVPISSQ